MRIFIETSYVISATTPVDLPDGKTWDDVESYAVKWNHLSLWFRDGATFSAPLYDAEFDSCEFKRPDSTSIYGADPSGEFPDANAILEQ